MTFDLVLRNARITAVAYKQAGLDKETVEALRNLGHVPNERLEAIARFTKAVIATRGAVGDLELETFKAAGFTDQAAEVLLGVSLATLCNFATTSVVRRLIRNTSPIVGTACALQRRNEHRVRTAGFRTLHLAGGECP